MIHGSRERIFINMNMLLDVKTLYTEREIDYSTTSPHANVFCVTVLLWEESTRYRWIPFTKGR